MRAWVRITATAITAKPAPRSYTTKQIFECDIIVKSALVSESDCELLKPNTLIISPIHLAVMRKNILENDGEKR